MMSMTAGGTSVTMIYDGYGNRVAKTVNGVTTYYLVDDLNPTGYPQVVEEVWHRHRRASLHLRPATHQREPADLEHLDRQLLRLRRRRQRAATDELHRRSDRHLRLRRLRQRPATPAAQRRITTSTAANNTTPTSASTTSAPDTTIQHRTFHEHAIPDDGSTILPVTLHKYLYATGDPVNRIDPRGRADLFEYAIESSAAVPEAKLLSIYGCVADAGLAAVDIILGKIDPSDTIGTIGTGLGAGSAVLSCVVLAPGLGELAEEGNRIVKGAQWLAEAAGWGSCAADAEDYLKSLNSLLSGSPNGDNLGKSFDDLAGCVESKLVDMLKEE